jgi:hypothetical protein
MLKFTAPVTGDVWWQDGQIKEEEVLFAMTKLLKGL